MKRIGQKQLSLLLCLVLLFTMVIPAGARASDYFNNTYVSATAVGGGTLRIKVDVAASGTMKELGPLAIELHTAGDLGILFKRVGVHRIAHHGEAGAHLHAKSKRQSDSKELCFQCNLPHIQRHPRKILLHHRALLRQKRQRHRGHLDRLQRGTGITITFPFRAVNDAARKFFYFFDPDANKSGRHDMYRVEGRSEDSPFHYGEEIGGTTL